MFLYQRGRQELRQVDSLRDVPPIDILVVGAHQDDEIFPAPYWLQQQDLGRKVGLVIATDGAGTSYANPETGQPVPPEMMIPLRNNESRDAAEYNGVEFLVLLNHPSSFVKNPETHPFYRNGIRKILERATPSEVLTHSPYDDHQTHLRVAEGVLTACRDRGITKVRGFPVWSVHYGREMGFDKPVPITFTQEYVDRQEKGFSFFVTQLDANRYDQAVTSRQRFQAAMADSHAAETAEYQELFVDYKPLLDGRFDGTFAEYAPVLERIAELRKRRVATGKEMPSPHRLLTLANALLLQQVRAIEQACMD